jgi:elongation factor 1-beta
MIEYNVSATLKIFVEDPEKIEPIKSEMEKIAKVQKFWEEEVGFGIKALKASVLMNDSEGGMDEFEEKVAEIEGVSQVEVEEVGRI